MENTERIRTHGHLTWPIIVASGLALAPILDPYSVIEIGSGFTLKFMDLFFIFVGAMLFCHDRRLFKKTSFLILWVFVFFLLTLFAFCVPDNTQLRFGISVKNLFIELVYAVLFAYIWRTPCRERFFRYVSLFCLGIAFVIFVQFVLGNAGIPTWNGRIPFLHLASGEHWSGYIDVNTRDIRPNGLFQEASYAGIYLMVGYAFLLKQNKLVQAMIIAAALCCTASLVSIVGLVLVTSITIVRRKQLGIDNSTIYKFIGILLIACVVVVFISSRNSNIASLINYLEKRFFSITSDLNSDRMGSTRYRLTGFIGLFPEYSFLQKVFGVGKAQYANYFGVKSYSNIMVTTILDHGIFGITCLLLLIRRLYKRISNENKIFFLIFILVLCVDFQWFSCMFFFLISACILENEFEEREE